MIRSPWLRSVCSRRVSWLHDLAAFMLIAVFTIARAEVVGIDIDRREPFAKGHAFGGVGPYEKVAGKLYLEVDPLDAANERVVDLKLAPRNADGKVEFWTEFFLLRPVDAARGNRWLFYDVNNRGNKLALGALNDARGNDPTTAADAGNGFLMRQGYAILWCGWNGDVAPGADRLQIELPIARDPSLGGDGTITGRIYSEICVDQKSFSEPLCPGNSRPYPAASLDNASATLTMRPRRSEPAVEVARDQWAFARWEADKAVPDPTQLHLKDGFRPGWLYDLVYVGKDPRVSGLGAVAVRDAVSFFRYAPADAQEGDNPLAGAIDRAYVFGISQSGRFIQHFLYEDFNADEKGRIVFDAAFSHVGAAATGTFNARFGQITRHGSPHEDNLYPSDAFPFATVEQTDPLTGRRGDMLARARRAGHLPKIFLTETSSEYWTRGGSLLNTDVEGKKDIALDPNVRLYAIAGGHHLYFSTPGRGIYQNEINQLNYRPLLRALLVAMDRWVTTGEAPPQSRYPRIADRMLVSVDVYREMFPRIPGVRLPESNYAPLRLDPGPRWETLGIADHVPPKVGPAYRTLVPAVDADGNEIAGVRLPDLVVPVATYVGWNLRAAECGAEGMLARWTGSHWPFPRTPEDRQRTGDPRRSILERYPRQDGYVARISEAAKKLQHERLLLAEDVAAIHKAAAEMRLWEAAKTREVD